MLGSPVKGARLDGINVERRLLGSPSWVGLVVKGAVLELYSPVKGAEEEGAVGCPVKKFQGV